MAILDKVKNFSKSQLVVAGVAAGALTFDLITGGTAKFPNPALGRFNIVVWNKTDYTDPADDPDVEIMRVTGVAGDTFTVLRAQEGTADVNHNTAGKTYGCILPITKKMIDDIQTALNLSSGGGSGGGSGFPISFALPDNGALTINGYQDREAFVYSDPVPSNTIALHDEAGNIQLRNFVTDWVDATRIQGYALIGNDLYVLLSDSVGTTSRIYKYDASDLSLGGTQMNVNGITLTYNSALIMTSNGTDIFINFTAGTTANAYEITKLSINGNGTDLDFVSTATCGSTNAQFNNAFAVNSDEEYFGQDATGIFYQYDSAGSLIYTSGDSGASGEMVNWSNTLFVATSDRIFTKLYLPNTSSGSGAGTVVSLTAAEDLLAGDKVGVSNLLDDYVAKALTEQYSTVPADVGNFAFIKAVEVDTDKFVALYSSSGVLKVVAVSVDRSDLSNAFTWGTGVNISATPGTANTPRNDICKVDTNKFAVVYSETGSPNDVQVVACTVATLAITVGTPAVANTLGGSVDGMSINQLDTDKCLVFGADGGSATGAVVACDTTNIAALAFGGVVNCDANLRTSRLASAQIDTDKFVISGGGYVQVGTVSTLTTTLGTAVQFDALYNNAIRQQVISPDTDVFVINYENNTTPLRLIAATVVGTVPTFGASISSNINSLGGGIYAKSATEILMHSGANQAMYSSILTGNTLAANTPVIDNFGLQAGAGIRGSIVDMNGYWFALEQTGVDYWVEGMTNQFIGITQNNAARGSAIRVLVAGVDSHQSGLKAGGLYQVMPGGSLSFISSTAASLSTPSEMLSVLKAISDTKIKI